MLTNIRNLASLIVLILSYIPQTITAQGYEIPGMSNNSLFANSLDLDHQSTPVENVLNIKFNNATTTLNNYQEQVVKSDSVPNPKSVMYKSLILPGWGQVVNRQAWKVPIIYGLLAGVTTYTFYAHNRYNGYKAAYYNSFSENTDLRFGPTPNFVLPGQPPELYRTNRNNFRNQRDMAIIGIVLAYGLNVVDAYIFAQLRDFDVSDNLSGGVDVKTEYFAGISYPNLNITFNF